MTELEDKKLLILGANPETVPLVETANKMKVRTLVTSNRPGDAAKKVAWKACDVDGLDVEGLLELAKKEKVDGVLVGVADILVKPYSEVCHALRLPCYASREIVDTLSQKDRFKETCELFGIKGIPSFFFFFILKSKDLENIKYPVMIKPVDSYSGIGMTLCHSEEEIPNAVNKALSCSRVRRLLAERYMECDDMGLYYTFKDGVCSASCIYDRYTTNEQEGFSRVCLGGTYPSKHIDAYFSELHGKMLDMFQFIGIKNGVLMLSAFYENGTFYVYDPGFRLQGEAPHLLMKAVHGFDQRELLVRYALTGSEGNIDLKRDDDPYFRGKWAATLWFLLKKGCIQKVEGLDRAEKDAHVVANVQRLFVGDNVPEEWIGTEKQVLSRLYLVCNSKEELSITLKYYMDTVHAYGENGEELLLRGFDVDKALG